MKLVGVSMVRNESDIVEAFVRHNLTVLDGLVVVDHGSADATLDILNALCRERLPVVLLRNEAVGYLQPAIMTQVVRHALATTGADFVFPLDADEFLRVPSREALERALAALPPNTHGWLEWPTYVPDLRAGACDSLAAIGSARRVSGDANALAKVVVARSFLQATDDVLSGGNHWVTAHPDARERGMRAHARIAERVAAVVHVPIRGVEQFVAKVAVKKLGRVAARIDWKPDAASQASWERLRAGEAVDVDALALAARNWSVPKGAWRDAAATTLVDDPFLAPIALRYTPRAPMAALPLVVSAVERMTRRLADARRSGAGLPSRPA